MLSFRWSCGLSLVMIELAVPCRKPSVGSGNALSIAMPFGLRRSAGMMLPWNGWPVSGSLMIRAPLKNPLAGSSSSLKSPVRIFAVGTVAVFVDTWNWCAHSWAAKKKNLSLKTSPGTGPPNEYPYCR